MKDAGENGTLILPALLCNIVVKISAAVYRLKTKIDKVIDLSEGERNFREIHILSDDERPVSPCGACRQVLFDYAPEIQVVMYGATGKQVTKSIQDLLPDGFNDDFLK